MEQFSFLINFRRDIFMILISSTVNKPTQDFLIHYHKSRITRTYYRRILHVEGKQKKLILIGSIATTAARAARIQNVHIILHYVFHFA